MMHFISSLFSPLSLAVVLCLNSQAQTIPKEPVSDASVETVQLLREFVNEMRALQVALRKSISLAHRAQTIAMQISLQEDRIDRLSQRIGERINAQIGAEHLLEYSESVEEIETQLKETPEPVERARLLIRLDLAKVRRKNNEEALGKLQQEIKQLENQRQQEQDRLGQLQRDLSLINNELDTYLQVASPVP